jgi:ADP-ribose pyrophosphatase
VTAADGPRAPREPFGHEELLASRVFRVERVRFVDGAGREIVREVVRHPGAVTVVPVLEDGRLVTIRNWRIAVGGWLEEFCAGKLEPGEDPAAAAARELEEECGYRAARIDPVGRFLTSPGFADERMHVFGARSLAPVPRRLEEGEEIEVVLRTPAEVAAMIRDGRIEDGKTIGAFAQWSLLRAGTVA